MHYISTSKQNSYESPDCALSECVSDSVLCESPAGGMIDDVTSEDFTW